MENKPTVTIKKVSIVGLLAFLDNLYHKGVDYVDIYSRENENPDEGDILGISFTREYMNEEHVDNFDNFEPDDLMPEDNDSPSSIDVNKKLSDNDLNDLV